MITAKEIKGFWAKSKGLINNPKPNNIFLKTRWGIHTFGLRFPIDVVILDNSNKVVALKENLKPNNIFIWNPRYKNVLELKSQTIKINNIKINSKLYLKITTLPTFPST